MIFALEYQLANDTNEKDREIHKAALEKLKAAIEKKPAEKVGFCFAKRHANFLNRFTRKRSHLTQDKSCPGVPLALVATSFLRVDK